MSMSLLCHGFGIRGYQYVRTRHEDGGVVFGIERPREQLRRGPSMKNGLSSREVQGVVGTGVELLLAVCVGRCVPPPELDVRWLR